jgi:hypothetical protein
MVAKNSLSGGIRQLADNGDGSNVTAIGFDGSGDVRLASTPALIALATGRWPIVS